MPTTVTYPNGQVLTSSALTKTDINILVQTLTCGMLGLPINPSRVRVDWQDEGQPDVATPKQDVCYINCVTHDVEYSRVRNRTITGTTTITETWVYTRGWLITWETRGPNSLDQMRSIHTALFQDYFNDAFALKELYPVLDPQEPVRIPTEHNGQWYDGSTFSCVFYEQVTETIQTNSVSSVEVAVYTGSPDDPVADITLTR